MALKINYNLTINYTLDRVIPKEVYGLMLSESQMNSLQDYIEKSFLINDAYGKIDSIIGDGELIELKFGVYKDATKSLKIANKNYSFTPKLNNSDNFIKQGYLFLKSLQEYSTAIDLLE